MEKIDKTYEQILEENLTPQNYGEFIDKEWSEYLQIEKGYKESHPMIPFDVFVKMVIEILLRKVQQSPKPKPEKSIEDQVYNAIITALQFDKDGRIKVTTIK